MSSAELRPGGHAPPPALCLDRRPGDTQPQEGAGRVQARGGVCADSAPGAAPRSRAMSQPRRPGLPAPAPVHHPDRASLWVGASPGDVGVQGAAPPRGSGRLPRSPAVLPLDPAFSPPRPPTQAPALSRPSRDSASAWWALERQTSSLGTAPLGQVVTVPEDVLVQQGRAVWPGPSRLLTACDPPVDAPEPPVKQLSLEMDGLGSDLTLPPSWADWPRDHGEPCRGPKSQFYHLEKRTWSSPCVAWYRRGTL